MSLTTIENLIGRDLFGVFTDDPDRPEVEGHTLLSQSLERVLTSRQVDAIPRMRFDVQTPDGTFVQRWWTVLNAPLFDASGEINAIIHQVTNVTELHLAETKVRESEARWHLLFDGMSEGFCSAEVIRDDTDRVIDYRFIEANPAFEEHTSKPPELVIGYTAQQIFPGLPQSLFDTFGEVVDTGNATQFEVQLAALNNRWFEIRASRIAPEQFSVLFLDITNRKLAQAELTNTAERYRVLFESIDEGFCIIELLFDNNEKVIDYIHCEVNPAFIKHTGWPDAVGKGIRELAPDIEAFWLETYGRVALTGEPVRVEHFVKPLNIWASVYAFRVGEPDQHRVAALFDNITERKHNEEALQKADVRKDEFIATLAHELRNPLAPLRTGLSILGLIDGTSDKAVQTRTMMDRQLTHLVELVDDLLDVSRVSRGEVVLKKSINSLQSVVDLALETSQPLVEKAGHNLHLDIPPESLMLDIDSTRIAQVLSNILNNAAKYTPDGGHLQLRAKRIAPERVCVEVEDNGMGIPDNMLERVFDLFTQVDHASGYGKGGLGIGLALSRRLVELHGGTLQVSSAGVGKGSTFTMELPAIMPQMIQTKPHHIDVAASDASVSENSVAAEAAGSVSSTDTSLVLNSTHKLVLLVDDNVDAVETLADILQLNGHKVRVVHNGNDALNAYAKDDAPEIVFLDIGLPDLSGYEVATELRKRPAFDKTVLIALTGWGADSDKQRAVAAGFDLHLTKPVPLDSLIKALSTRRSSKSLVE